MLAAVADPENHEMLAENVKRDDDRLTNQTGGTPGDQRFDLRIDTADRHVPRQQVTHTFVRRDVKYPGNNLNGTDPKTPV